MMNVGSKLPRGVPISWWFIRIEISRMITLLLAAVISTLGLQGAPVSKKPTASTGLSNSTTHTKPAPLVRQTALFHSGLNGIHAYRVPGVVKTPSGALFVYCEARRNSATDWGEIEIHSRRSVDGGETWESPRQVAHLGRRHEGNPTKRRGGESEQTAHGPTAVITADGRILLLYCLNYSRCFITESPDDGVSFSAPREITSVFDRL